MNRFTRSVPLPRLFTPAATPAKSASRRGRTSLLLQLSPPIPPIITSPAARPVSTWMESPDPFPATTEDFVHIESPSPNPDADPLSESIVNVEDELRRDAEEATGHGTVPPESHGNDDDDSGGLRRTGRSRRDGLPEELSRSVVYLTCESSHSETGTCDVYLVGTAHVSLESCKEVQAVIGYLQPEVVFLELCASRVAVLTPQNIKIPTMAEMIEMYKKKHNVFGILYSWFLAKVASKLEVFPGSEFRVAYEEGRKYGAKVILGDRPVQLKEMDDVDMLTLVIQEMSKKFPTLMETLVHERDQYMSSKLYRIAGEHTSVVAVVGKGHLQGIKNHWKQPVKINDLLEIPTEKPTVSAMKILTSIGVGVAGVAIISGLYLAHKK